MGELRRRCKGAAAARRLAVAAVLVWSALAAGPALGAYQFVRAWGKSGSHAGQFFIPWGVALGAHDHLYVVDRGNARVEEFTESGHFIRQWSHDLSVPNGDAVDAAGNVFVADSDRDAVLEFSPSGHLIRKWTTRFTPNFVAARGNSVWYSSQIDSVKGDPTNGNGFVAPIDSDRSIAYGSPPWGIAFGNAGQIYLARPLADDVLEYKTHGALLHAWGSKGKLPWELNSPAGVAVDRWGNVYVVDSHNGRISKFTSSGALLDTIGSRGKGAGQMIDSVGIAVDDSGNVFVVDTGNSRIEEFAPVFPQTFLDFQLINPNSARSLDLGFHANRAGMTFQCKLDSSRWTDCTSHSGYTGAGQFFATHLANGKHTFEVRATDSSGNTDPTPAKISWVTDHVGATRSDLWPLRRADQRGLHGRGQSD